MVKKRKVVPDLKDPAISDRSENTLLNSLCHLLIAILENSREGDKNYEISRNNFLT